MIKQIAKVCRRIFNKEYPHEKFLREFKFPNDIKSRYANVNLFDMSMYELGQILRRYEHMLDTKRIKNFSYVRDYRDSYTLTYKKHIFLLAIRPPPEPRKALAKYIITEKDDVFIPYMMYIAEYYQQYLEMKEFHEESQKVINKINAIEDLEENNMNELK